MPDHSYLLSLAEKLYLTPSDDVLNECFIFLEQAKSDLELLKSLSPKSGVHYVDSTCSCEQSEFEGIESKVKWKLENEELLKSLLRDNAVISIKKVS